MKSWLVMVLLLGASGAAAQPMPDGARFRDTPDSPEMIVIPAGSFWIGSPPTDPDRESSETPRVEVTIERFALGRTHVTRGEFAAFVAATNFQQRGGCRIWRFRTPTSDPNLELAAGAGWRNPGYPQMNDHPVVCISRDDAVAYTQWLSRYTGQRYRLPSEAEWEYAARAGTATIRWWGDGLTDACESANAADIGFYGPHVPSGPFAYFPCRDGHIATAPVASFRANPFGLHDMLGNAWQWVADCYMPTYSVVPANGAARMQGDCRVGVVRGGSWASLARHVRAAYRGPDVASERFLYHGFRIARTLVGSRPSGG